ncbi:MAG: 50S ribosomal protein L4 [Desulfatibacillaceae bacterium]
MAVVDVVDKNGEKVREVELSDAIFGVDIKPEVLHEVVTMQLAKRRSGTACVKNRSDIRASTKKLYRQKGTGRARRGSRRSPLLRGGGVVFGPHPRSYAFKVPKKVRRLALKMALSAKLADNTLKVVDDMNPGMPKTKEFVKIIDALGVKDVLIITGEKLDNLVLSSRNVPDVKVLPAEGLNVYDILKYDHLILLEPTLEAISGRFE